MDSSSSGGSSNRSNQNRSRGGRNRNQNRNRNRGPKKGGSGGGGGGRPRPRREEDDIMRERFPRPEPKPSLLQRILAFFGIGGDEAKSKSGGASSKPDAGKGRQTGPPKSRKSHDASGERKPKKKRAKRPVEKVAPSTGRLYVGNLDYGVTDDELAEFFKSAGEVVKAEVVIHQRSGKSKGFGFVEMASVEDAQKACDTLHDQEIRGRQILVSGAKSEGQRDGEDSEDGGEKPKRERKPRSEKRERGEGEGRGGRSRRGGKGGGSKEGESEAPRKPKAPTEKVTGTKLSIGNLPGDASAADVKEGIEDIAPVTGLGEATGGAVVVEFASVEDAQRALDVLSGKVFMGNALKVTGASDGESVSAPAETPAPESGANPPEQAEEAATPNAPEQDSQEAAESAPEPETEPAAEPVKAEEESPDAEPEAEAAPEVPSETPAASEPESPSEPAEPTEGEEKPAEPQS